jgi:hypothetical protein
MDTSGLSAATLNLLLPVARDSVATSLNELVDPENGVSR